MSPDINLLLLKVLSRCHRV